MKMARSLALAAALAATTSCAMEAGRTPGNTAVLSCPGERARYRGMGAPDIVAELERAGPGTGAASDLLLRLRLPAPTGEMWFRFEASLGYSRIVILPVAAPTPQTAEDGIEDLPVEGDLVSQLELLPIDGELRILPDAPRSGTPAPRYLLLPGLGRALHYGLLPQQEQAGQEARGIPTVFWELDGCRR